MNDEFRREFAGTGHCSISDRNKTDLVTFLLNNLTAFSYNSACNSSTMLKVRISRIYYCVNLSFCNISLNKTEGSAVYFMFCNNLYKNPP
jgi:hypothetical protein